MRELVFEVLIRLIKPIAATVVGLFWWGAVVGIGGATPSAELVLLCWLAGAATILLVQESSI